MKRKKFKRIISMIVCLCIIFSGVICVKAAEEVNFDDVKNYYPFNKWAVDTGIKYSFIFLENNTRDTQRVEIASIIASLLDIKSNKTSKVSFNDVDSVDSIQKKNIEIVTSQNIVNGYEDGSFKPFNSVTRAEFATILDRANLIKEKNSDNSVSFDDIDNHWGKTSILKIAKCGIVNGKDNNKFCPDDTITPQEIFVILDRLVSNSIITKDKMLNAMLNTFKCKVYDEKEKYIAEEMYGNFDAVQSELKYSWPHSEEYDPSNWQSLATYEDLQYAIFFTSTEYSSIIYKEEAKNAYNNIIKASYFMQGLEPDNEKNGKKNFCLKDLFKAYKASYYNSYRFDEKRVYEVWYESDYTRFINSSTFSNEDIISLGLIDSLKGKNNEKIIPDEYVYLPLDAPVTKYMLNYFITKFRHKGWHLRFVSEDLDLEFETDPSKLPYNYNDYPYIIKGIPKEAYEKSIEYYAEKEGKHTPKRTYLYRYGDDMANIVKRTNAYYNQMLNIDYTEEDFAMVKHNLIYNSYYSEGEDVDKYIQYIKDNEIILKGTATAIPGSVCIYEPFCYIRVIFDFEIVHSNTNKNLLFGDLEVNKGVVYENNKYYFVADVQITGGLDIETLEFVDYSPVYYNCIYESLYPNGDEYIMR